jgi:hypothetical protein
MPRAADKEPMFAWPRFWIPLGGAIDLSDSGFLTDPLGSHDPDAPRPLAALRGWRSLALLGEPGIGKSTTLKEEADQIEAAGQEGVLQSCYVDLRSFSSEVLLFRKVFESEKMIQWKSDGSHLVLFLDSLDEALLRIDSIANLIADELPNLPVDRLSIRIACRTAVWPADTLGAALEKIWGDQAGTFELTPLRREDIFTALDAHGIAGEGFMRAMFSAHAVPFAIKPLTLRMLLAIYRQHGALPDSSIELYKRGCLALCDESNKSRRDAGRRGRLNAGQRMRLAGRMAAATIVGNRFAIWTGTDADCPEEDIPVSALAGRRETGDFATFVSSSDDVRETLDTGLFGSHGEQQMGWAHRSYGEFLAVLYLHERGVPAETVLKAVRHPAGGLIPQLSSVAAWAASLDEDVRSALIGEDPVALLGGDLSGLGDVTKSAILKSLLDAVQKKRVTDSVYKHSEIYAKLKHLGLASDLRPFVLDKTLEPNTRRLALLVAERCSLADLRSELLQIALDAADHPQVRSGAIAALRSCCDADVEQQILPFADGTANSLDSNDEIRGTALQLLWPDHITAAQLFPLLTPTQDNFFGAYAHFLMMLPETLKEKDLLPALQWATGAVARGDRPGNGRARSLADAIMFKVWPIFDITGLTDALVDHIAARLRNHGPLFLGFDRKAQNAFAHSVTNDTDRRRKFLTALCKRSLTQIDAFIFKRNLFVRGVDLEWLLSIAPGGNHEAQDIDGGTLFNLIDCTFDDENIDHVEALHAAIEQSSVVRDRYGPRFDAVALDSPMAEDARRHKAELRAIEDQLPPPVEPDPQGRIRALLAEAESGRWQAWWHVTVMLGLTPTSRGFGDELDYFIVTTPGWNEADRAIRDRIIAGAEPYLDVAETNIDEWLGLRSMPVFRNVVAGLRALILLKQTSPERYDRIKTETWRKWAPVVVGLPRDTEAKQSRELRAVLVDALERAPDEFILAIRTIIRIEREDRRKDGADQNGSPFLILGSLDGCWQNAPLRDAILEELRDLDNTPAEYAALLDALLKANMESSLDHALERIGISAASMDRRHIAIIDVLLRRAPAQSWPTISAAMEADDAFARQLITRIAQHFEFGTPFYRDFDEQDIATFFRLVTRLYPPSDDQPRQTGFMGTWDSISYLRDSLPRHLAGLGTEAAVSLLNQLIAEYPQLTNLAYELTLGERAMRLATWSPLSPKEVLALSDRPSLKLVNSPSDLSDILIAALTKFADSLHGAQTPVRDLWDRQASQKEVYRPIDENGFTDVVTRFLRSELAEKGVSANREVEVGRVPGAPVGKRTDILVNAVRRKPDGETYDVISAVIETKGCWNDELFTALEAQLFRDYMVRLRAPAGVYLVAWFETDKWDPSDSRRKAALKLSLDGATAELERQAKALTSGIIVRPVVIECRAPS